MQNKQEVRTAVVVTDGSRSTVISGFKDHGPQVHELAPGLPQDQYTTLPETTVLDHVHGRGHPLATTPRTWTSTRCTSTRSWTSSRTTTPGPAGDPRPHGQGRDRGPPGRSTRSSSRASTTSLDDLAFCGMDNPKEMHYAADRPFGLIEATVQRKGRPADENAWMGITGFC
ncbi:hypothetical protein QJS66_10680 [Kocuria rhizophila]|nr:hypothetical protein QJS66_10680 [Kocuria rhizophila]